MGNPNSPGGNESQDDDKNTDHPAEKQDGDMPKKDEHKDGQKDDGMDTQK